MTATEDLFAEPYPDLHPDLLPYLAEADGLGACIRHPLVYSIPHFPALNRVVNRQYEAKEEQVMAALTGGDWGLYLALHERPWRTTVLHQLAYEFGVLNDEEFWRFVASTWTDTENVGENADLWDELWGDPRPGRTAAMDDEERAAYEALAPKINLYRGTNGMVTGTRGRSWTLSSHTGVTFAERATRLHGGEAWLHRITVRKEAVLAVILRRGESEVVVDPAAVAWETLASIPARLTPIGK